MGEFPAWLRTVPAGLGRCSWRTQPAWRRAPQSKSQLFPVSKQPWRCDSVSPKRAPGCRAGTSPRLLFVLTAVCTAQGSLTIQTGWGAQCVLPPQLPAFPLRPFPASGTKSQIPTTARSALRALTTAMNAYSYLPHLLISVSPIYLVSSSRAVFLLATMSSALSPMPEARNRCSVNTCYIN